MNNYFDGLEVATVKIKRAFIYESFALENKDAKPEAYLPENLADFWIDGVLNSLLSGSESAIDISNSIINLACTVLAMEIGEGIVQKHRDIYLQEIIMEKLSRINRKAAITNSSFDYIPAEVDNIFTGPHIALSTWLLL